MCRNGVEEVDIVENDPSGFLDSPESTARRKEGIFEEIVEIRLSPSTLAL